MNLKAVAEIRQSEFTVNILENEKYHETDKPKESKPITSKDVENDEDLKEEQFEEVNGDEEKVEKAVKKGVRDKDSGKKLKGEKQRQQITWVQFGTGFGSYGSDYDERGSRFYYESDRNDYLKYPLIIVAVLLCLNIGYLLYIINSNYLREPLIELDFYLYFFIGLLLLVPPNCIMFCSDCFTRVPFHYLFLAMAVVGACFLTFAYTCRHITLVPLYVSISILTVVAVCIALSFTQFNFRAWYLYVIGIITAFAATCIVMHALKNNDPLKEIPLNSISWTLLPVGTVLHAIMFILELQLIIGGGKIVMGENEVVYTAFLLYTAPVDVFIKIFEVIFGTED
ncbi:uncharacterized protein LOC123703034 [Colias croceus]|uniref:uncharacterized protein LOC123703034 n=1 Tax=Colias crocea TaxID=72248 RepID=UPI001E27ADD5|nr:uncharacterized protein LOC123703034 [Colias croceus]